MVASDGSLGDQLERRVRRPGYFVIRVRSAGEGMLMLGSIVVDTIFVDDTLQGRERFQGRASQVVSMNTKSSIAALLALASVDSGTPLRPRLPR